MALLFADGFDCYADTTQWIESHWGRSFTAVNINTSEGRFGGGAIKFTSSTLGQARTGVFVDVSGTIIIGFSVKHDGAGGVVSLLTGLSQTGTQMFRVEYTASTGNLRVFNRANTQVGSDVAAALASNTWYWLEVKVVLGNASNNGDIEIRQDGSSIFTSTGQDFRSGTSNLTGVHTARWGAMGSSGGNFWIDDVTIVDGAGSSPTDFLGPTRIDTHVPNAAGGTTDWTPNTGTQLAAVDDGIGAANDDTDYIESSTAAEEARFGMSNLAVAPDNIHAVQVRTRAKKANAGARTMRALINVSGSEATGPTVGIPTNYCWMRNGIFRNNPNTSAPFNATGFNAMQAGVEVVA